MTPKRKGILLLARNSGLAGMVLRDEPRRAVRIRIRPDERRIRAQLVAADWDEAHRFGAAGDDGRSKAAHDALGGERNRLKPGRTESIHGDCRGRHWNSGAEARDARDV